jgi:hypothetical protein
MLRCDVCIYRSQLGQPPYPGGHRRPGGTAVFLPEAGRARDGRVSTRPPGGRRNRRHPANLGRPIVVASSRKTEEPGRDASRDPAPFAPPERGEGGKPGAFRDPGSFRDPAAFVYRRDGVLYRQINQGEEATWDAFRASGLLDSLVAKGWLVEQEEVDSSFAFDDRAATVLRPRELAFVSYPYEWTFSQLKDAALLTLDVQSAALATGMTLKDASAYNITFDAGRPVMIDALSFEPRTVSKSWYWYPKYSRNIVARQV